jgi:hypothetical protein
LGAHRREKRRRENGDVPGQLLGKGRGAGAYPLTRERVQRLQEVEKKRRQASIEKGHRSPSLLLSYHESQEMAL